VAGARATVTLAAGSVPHRSATATLVFSPYAATRDAHAVISVFCKRPDANGSLVAKPASAATHGRRGRAMAPAVLHERPSGTEHTGGVHADQPLKIVATARRGRWVQVVTDDGQRGWLRADGVRAVAVAGHPAGG
jgi:hypothetical protein